ncbi:MAG: response regulator [Hyphomicrobiales bacterium]|nr:response regulator [Hyphomicrobiales bacterium]
MLEVLIVEDDPMIAEMTKDFLVGCGYGVCGVARAVDEAVALAFEHHPDLLVLDVRLADGGLGTEIPGRLTSLGRVGVLYATGNTRQLLQNGAPGDACLSKPYSFADLRRSLEIVTQMVASGVASLPFPRGFQILKPMVIGAGRGR